VVSNLLNKRPVTNIEAIINPESLAEYQTLAAASITN